MHAVITIRVEQNTLRHLTLGMYLHNLILGKDKIKIGPETHNLTQSKRITSQSGLVYAALKYLQSECLWLKHTNRLLQLNGNDVGICLFVWLG